MNEQELNLTKLSYVDKDFASIYPDLLDLVKMLTNRWDPSTSNESDPGVVLLKIGAFLADHLNYNIDKNILECFLPSATQEESVRKIAEFGGYVPKYYRSAVGNVSVTYNPNNFITGFTIPEFSIVISNDDGSITYTQLDPIAISSKNSPTTVNFIEGTLQRLSVDSDIITLDNLDNNNRIYFPNQYIAENGVFIYNTVGGQRASGAEAWKKTDYIYTRPIGTKCYKIDYDSSRNLPYIEFPSDIANLIGDGLAIFYIYTSGSYGNVKAKELNKVVSINVSSIDQTGGIEIVSDDFVVSNNGAILNGCEPENIDEIYQSYKKIVGTFDTLVSTQDYSNAIRTAEDSYGENIISNGLVTDRRIDYNNAINVVVRRLTGTGFENVALNKFGKFTFNGSLASEPTNPERGWIYTNSTDGKTYLCTDVTTDDSGTVHATWEEITSLNSDDINEYLDGMTPYDLIIYALQKYSASDYNSVYYWQALKNSFLQIPGDSDPNTQSIGDVESNLIDSLEENKCINHIFKDLRDGQIYCFKNYVPLTVDIIPYNKVTKYERNEILDNIRRALSDNFNSSKVEFGEELNYDEVKGVIEGADPRINYVRLSDFNYTTKVMLKDSTPENAEELLITDNSPIDGSMFLVDLAAKNVLSGRLCLFDFDDNFNYQYGQTDCNVYPDIVEIKTSAKINAASGLTYRETLEKNTYLEILYPSYYSKETYGSYVLYNFYSPNNKIILAGTEYTLQSDETLSVYYKDSTGKITTYEHKAGETIQPSFDLYNFDHPDNNNRVYTKDNKDYNQLASNESISTRVLLETEFNNEQYVYWIVNNTGGVLFPADEDTKVLDDGEFFIYTDSTKTNLTILGRGTKLVRSDDSDPMVLTTSSQNKITQTQLNEEGLAAKIPFTLYNFGDNELKAIEMNIITLGEGDYVQFKGTDSSINYKLQNIDEISYRLAGETATTTLPKQDNFYEARTRLDVVIAENSPQYLTSGQWIQIKYADGSTADIDGSGGGRYIQSNVNLNLIGSTNWDSGIDISIFNDFGIPVNWLSYKTQPIRISRYVDSSIPMGNNEAGWGYNNTLSEYKYFIAGDGQSRVGYNRCITQIDTNITQQLNSDVAISLQLDVPRRIELPFSTLWYDYLTNSEAIIDREYICQLYLSNPNERDGWVYSRFFEGSNPINMGKYGSVGDNSTDRTAYLLNNKSIYIYPEITSTSQKNLVLRIETSIIENGVLSISNPRVSWGGNTDLGATKNDIQVKMEDLLDKTSSDIQFHWLNEPAGDLAMTTTDLTDPYSLFDKNNVANIITL